MSRKRYISKTSLRVFEFYRKQYENAVDLSGKILPDTREETIHAYRLAFKRLRLVCNYLARTSDTDAVEFTSGVMAMRQNYKVMGRLRNIQIRLKVLKSIEKESGRENSAYTAALQKKAIRRLKAISQLREGTFGTGQLMHPAVLYQLILSGSCRPGIHAIKEFLEYELNVARNYFTVWHTQRDEKALHLARRHIKDMYFMMIIAEKKTLTYHGKIFKVEKLRKWEQHIGQWHDHILMRDALLNHLISSTTNMEEQREHFGLAMSIQEVINKMETRILRYFPNAFSIRISDSS